MRSYYIIILLLLSTLVLAQDATFTISAGQTVDTDSDFIVVYEDSTQDYTHDLGSLQYITSVTVTAQMEKCTTGYNNWNCGSIMLCLSVDGSAATCKTLANQQLNGPVWTLNKQAQLLKFTLQGSRLTTSYQVKITKISTISGITNTISRSLFSLRGTGLINLGRADQLLDTGSLPTDTTIIVSSNNPKAVIWLDDGSTATSTSRKQSSNYQDDVVACLNDDQNVDPDTGDPVCDYQDELICTQKDPPEDWLLGDCCGDAPYYNAAGCNWYSAKNAICAQKTDDSWVWLALVDKGLITNVDGKCGTFQVVPDGSKFYSCTQVTVPSGITASLFDVITGKKDIVGHEYVCDTNNNIIECGGDTLYSETAKATGYSMTINSMKQYCTATGKWTNSLDNYGKDSCEKANLKWTGTKCCGETDDSLKTYEDPYVTGQGTAGGCYNNQFIKSGDPISSGSDIINYRGEFYQCDPTLQPGITGTGEVLPGTTLTAKSRGPCGAPLQGARFSTAQQHTICSPAGNWLFTASTAVHLVKETKWTPPSETEQRQGCCPDNQCWDGTRCKIIGEYYVIGDRGYRCQ